MKKILIIFGTIISINNAYAAEPDAYCTGKLITRTFADKLVDYGQTCGTSYVSVGAVKTIVNNPDYQDYIFGWYMYVPKNLEFVDSTGTWVYSNDCTNFQ